MSSLQLTLSPPSKFSRRWRLAAKPGSETEGSRPSIARAHSGRQLVWQRAAQWSLGGCVWELEIIKSCYGLPERDMAVAFELMQQIRSGADVATVCVEQACALSTIRLVLSSHGIYCGGLRRDRLQQAISFALAWFAALLAIFLHLLRHLGRGSFPKGDIQKLFAVHGEWSNRTRHLIQLLPQHTTVDAILLLGMARKSVPEILREWNARSASAIQVPIVVPFSLTALVFSMPRMLIQSARGLRRVLASPVEYRPRELSAIICRVMLGEVSAHWWQLNNRAAGQKVVYAHTGTADTTRLEQAQQQQGADTMHVLHGACSGINFVGRSTHALFRCGHDAANYRQHGIYQRHHIQRTDGNFRAPQGAGVLLMTNYAHPLNPGYAAWGIRDELQVLEDVSHTLTQLELQGPRVWRAHPAFKTLPEHEQQTLRQHAESLGWRLSAADEPLENEANRHAILISTASSIVLDLLVRGWLPAVYDLQGVPDDEAVTQLPTLARNAHELKVVISRQAVQSSEQGRQCYEAAFARVQPAAPWHGDLFDLMGAAA